MKTRLRCLLLATLPALLAHGCGSRTDTSNAGGQALSGSDVQPEVHALSGMESMHAVGPMPVGRGGADLLGTSVAPELFGRYSGPGALTFDAPATLVRFWTDTCPFCEASLPALETLRERHAERGLATLGVYHPKPPRAVRDSAVDAWAKERGYTGPTAIDPEWAALQSLWLETGRRPATSFSLLLDSRGKVRFVHPGPEFFPASQAEDALANADFQDLETAIQVLLAEYERSEPLD